MTLRASLLRQLENSSLSVDRRAELCCEASRELEDKGKYEEARKMLIHYWSRIGQHPKVEGLELMIAAEVLLRARVLTGYVGSKNKITDTQETAKDLISEGHAKPKSDSGSK